MKNNTYRVFAFSQDVIDNYNKSNKSSDVIKNTDFFQFDTVLIYSSNDEYFQIVFFQNGIWKSTIGRKYDSLPIFEHSIELVGTIQPEQKEEYLFCVGDRVYQYFEGWGTVTNIDLTKTHPISVKFDSEKLFHFEINEIKVPLSFTEYNFINGGWSQERPKPLPKVGYIGYFWDDDDLEQKKVLYGELKNIDLSHKSQRYYAEDIWLKYFSTEKPF